jgi:hypothetical protein
LDNWASLSIDDAIPFLSIAIDPSIMYFVTRYKAAETIVWRPLAFWEIDKVEAGSGPVCEIKSSVGIASAQLHLEFSLLFLWNL